MKSTSTTRPDAERGFSMVAAIFILVVLAALGGFLVSTAGTQHMTIALDVMNARARLAANSGIEWAVYQVVKASPVPTFRTDCEAVAASYGGATPATQAFTGASAFPGLADMRVDVECRSESFNEAGTDYSVYEITATACNAMAAVCSTSPPGLGYVEHWQRARVMQ